LFQIEIKFTGTITQLLHTLKYIIERLHQPIKLIDHVRHTQEHVINFKAQVVTTFFKAQLVFSCGKIPL